MAQSNSKGARGGISPRDLIQSAKETVQEMTGYPPEAVSGLERDDDTWLVTVDVLELERVPSTTDVLATYVVEFDTKGELLGYKRTRRFQRAQVEES
jgi:Gas vesicle synthesis protein GvpO